MIFIEENEILEDIDGLINLTSLQHNTNINNNPSLKNIDGLQNAIHTGTASVPRLNIYGNSSLNLCCGALSFMNSPEVSPSISNNAPGCNSKDEIRSSCNSEPISLKFEAEDHYSVLTDVGNYNIGVNLNGSMSNQYAVTMYDKGDQVNINFNVPKQGEYIIKVNLRSGHRFNATAYWPSGYLFQLNGENINLEGNEASVSPFQANHGGSYFGNMVSEKVFLSAGEHNLAITTNSKWSLIDYIEVIGEGQETVNLAPTKINLSNSVIYTNYTGVVATISVEDPDLNDTHSFELTSNEENFKIEANTLHVTTEYPISQSAIVGIKVIDSEGNQYEEQFTLDIQESPTCNGYIVLSSQEEVDNFNCTSVAGVLKISGDDITNLEGLNGLESIRDGLLIVDNPLLTSLDGMQLQEGVYDLVISNNSLLEDISALTGISVSFSINIQKNPSLKTLNGLQNIGALRYISIIENNVLQNLDGLDSLYSVRAIAIRNNASLTNINGLASLTEVEYTGSVMGNTILTEFCGLYNLAATGNRSIQIENNAVNPTYDEIVDSCNNPSAKIQLSNNIVFKDSPRWFDSIAEISVGNADENKSYSFELVNPGPLRINGSRLYLNYNATLLPTFVIRIKATDEKGNQIERDFIIYTREYVECGGDVVLSTQEEVDNFNCNTITGSLSISGSDITDLSALKNLKIIGGDLSISETNLVNLNGLEGLSYFVGSLNISKNNKLEDISTLSDISEEIGPKYVNIESNPLLKNLDGLEQIKETEAINIINNVSLENVDGLRNVILYNRVGNFSLRITDNTSLSACCGVLDFMSSPSVDSYISNNDSGCNTKLEIEEACNEQPMVTTRFEAEDHFSVLTDIGSYNIGTNGNGSMSNGEAVTMYDNGDKIRLDFTVPSSGNYQLAVNLRSGHRFNSVAYWPSGYAFKLNGTTLTMQGNNATISNLLSSYGGAYFGNMEATAFLSEGSHYLEIEANASWTIIDYLEVTGMSASARLGNLNQPEKEEGMLNIDDLTVYPNPTSGLLNISFNSSGDLPIEIKLLDSTGRIVEKRRYEGNIDDTINLSSYAKGYYIITMQSGGEIHHKKIILN